MQNQTHKHLSTWLYNSLNAIFFCLIFICPKAYSNTICGKNWQNCAYLGGLPIVINPYLGSTPNYDGSNLLSNLTDPNTDLFALQYRQEIQSSYQDAYYYAILSGSLEGQVYSTKTYIGTYISDIDLIDANISILGAVSKWVTGFLNLQYDNAPPGALNPPQYGPRFLNSKVYIDQAFLTLGNLDFAHWFITMGQLYLPYGSFDSYMINDPLTESLFTIVERPISLGFSYTNPQNTIEFDAAVYTYQGETTTLNTNNNNINEGGAALNLTLTQARWNAAFGLGVISNVADTEAFLLNGQNSLSCKVFNGYAYPCNNGLALEHKVPGFDLHVNASAGPLSFTVEYMTAVRHFSKNDLTYNKEGEEIKGAKPAAFDAEAGLSFYFFNKPSSIAIGYSFTREALALLMPMQEYAVSFNTSLWQNTLESIGYQHDINYPRHAEATGQGGLPAYSHLNRKNLGRSSNSIVFAISVNF